LRDLTGTRVHLLQEVNSGEEPHRADVRSRNIKVSSVATGSGQGEARDPGWMADYAGTLRGKK
jgi:hypothetical protein